MVYSWSDMWPFLHKSKRLILIEDAMTRSPATSLPIASPYPSGPLKWPVPPRTASWLRLGSAWKLPSSVRDLFFWPYRSQQGNIGKQWENIGRVKPPSTVIWGSFADDPLTSTVVTKPLSCQPRRSWIFAYASIQRVSLVEKIRFGFRIGSESGLAVPYQLILESDCSWDPPPTLFQVWWMWGVLTTNFRQSPHKRKVIPEKKR